MLTCTQKTHYWNCSQLAILQVAVNIFYYLRAVLLKIQVLWGVAGILGLPDSEHEASKSLFISRLMHSIIQNLEVKIYVV